MEILLTISFIAWIITFIVLENHIKTLEYEIKRLRDKLIKYERNERTRIR